MTNNNVTQRSYVSIVNNYSFPTKDQAIVFPVVDGILKNDYILAVGKIYNTVSNISFISAGITNQEFKRVMNFKRQVYINLNENDTLPDSLLITYANEIYRIFLSTDKIRCFRCKRTGHIAEKCTENPMENTIIEQTENSIQKERSQQTVNLQEINKNNEKQHEINSEVGDTNAQKL